MAFRLATWPPPEDFARTPYTVAFYEAIKPFGVVPVMAFVPEARWVRAHAQEVDGLHIHWPEGLWRRRTHGSLAAQLKKTLSLRRVLRAARAAGLKIIWTIHNHSHHEGSTWLDRYCYRLLAAHVDLFICHSRWSAGVITAAYRPSGRVIVMPHGSFPGVYPQPRSREVVLRDLGLSADRPTICAVGNIRIYKGLDVARDAVVRLNGAVQLIIAGRTSGRPVDVEDLRRSLTAANCGIVIDRPLSTQEFADVVSVSEAVLLPYRNITTSGVLLTAWTLGRGVVASDGPYFTEIAAPEPDAARLFATGDAGAMSDAIREYLTIPAGRRTAAATRMAGLYAWDRCVQPLREVFESWERER